MSAVLLALVASVSWGVADFGAGVASRRLAVPLVILGSQGVGLAFATVVVLAAGQDVPPARDIGWGLLAGAIGIFALGAFYRGLQIGAMGIIGPISASAAVVPLAYGLARGERPSTMQLLGVVLAVVGVVAASVERHPETRGGRIGAGVGFALIAALGFGCSLIALSKASAGGWTWAPFFMRCAGVPLALAVVLATRPPLGSVRRNVPLLAGVGLTDTFANFCVGLAYTRGLVSVVSVLASLYPVVLVALAHRLLHERPAPHQLSGAAVALAGVALVSAG